MQLAGALDVDQQLGIPAAFGAAVEMTAGVDQDLEDQSGPQTGESPERHAPARPAG